MRRHLFEGLTHAAAHRSAARTGRCGARRTRGKRSTAPRGAGSAAASRSAQVDAGSCNGCELEIHALNNAFYDLERFGLRFVASPRHADVLLVTGPVTKNMREALERTYDATPDPKWVVARRRLRRDGGIFAGSYAVAGGVSTRWCRSICTSAAARPPPETILKGLISLLEPANGRAVAR